ncbi:hypothetical protein [Acidisphaera rubrifaciens]|uniref:Uncharacterized protein n=1 Tax=Acidisphaera rubrifaciens HS-AP3 TaxID=1231350 RepID=A0A0D6P602_9PROT|nr:hypothetical protein [Acidisphaera rubrifaciens]GAN76309.1 hypothetical protein Asru_0084_20 [Acidisphaera rubrifaciens HS-AP3]
MTRGGPDTLSSPPTRTVRDAADVGSPPTEQGDDLPRDRFTVREAAFIAARDSFYTTSISPSGWAQTTAD